MKAKILTDVFYGDLEQQLNHFIKDKKIKDIKYSCTNNFGTALVMYEETNDENY